MGLYSPKATRLRIILTGICNYSDNMINLETRYILWLMSTKQKRIRNDEGDHLRGLDEENKIWVSHVWLTPLKVLLVRTRCHRNDWGHFSNWHQHQLSGSLPITFHSSFPESFPDESHQSRLIPRTLTTLTRVSPNRAVFAFFRRKKWLQSLFYTSSNAFLAVW